MPSQTRDLEAAICADLSDSPLTVREILERHGDIIDPRWVMVALVHLRQDYVLRYVGCGAGHRHDGDCRVELTPVSIDDITEASVLAAIRDGNDNILKLAEHFGVNHTSGKLRMTLHELAGAGLVKRFAVPGSPMPRFEADA
ncbi:hypothetical protein [Paractinoplanes toevensis]|uniref:Uncharacterized protein n=1 Tax=Paractinoplanes toevensis TaxID=571911 RepID=A0A919W7C3_9ACTN|nr:hypothetical protein [Actinoplanes toevensis]GIM88806.1 hypothetical protein Ato02nite_005990 [Actinoplanes toevensis]